MLKAEPKWSELDVYNGTKYAVPFESSSKNSNSIKEFEKIFSNKHISFIDYNFLAKIDRNFINITKYESDLKSSFFYKNNQLNFDQAYLRKIMIDYVKPEDLNSSLIAGGCFSKYSQNNPISIKFPELFNQIARNSDIDIYIKSPSCDQYMHLMRKQKLKPYGLCSGAEMAYKYESFKITTKNNETVNFVFKSEANEDCLSTQDLLYDFDLDHAKIFYSYVYDSIFVHISFFTEYRSMLNLKKSSNLKKVQDLDSYAVNLSDQKAMIETVSAQKLKNEVAKDTFVKMITTDFIRFIKYCFKGYANTQEDVEKYIELIDFYYKKYKQVIDYKVESMMSKSAKMQSEFVKSYLEFLLMS